MALVDIYPRRDWLGSDTMDTRGADLDQVAHVVIHTVGTEWSPIADTVEVMQRINNWSTREQGYPLAYNWGVGQSGDAWDIRGLDYRNYANNGDHSGFEDFNFNWRSVSILVFYDSNEPVRDIQIQRAAELIVAVERELGRELTVIGHRDSDHTTCPDDELYARLPDIRARVAEMRNPTPTPDLDIEEDIVPSIIKLDETPATWVAFPGGKWWIRDSNTFNAVRDLIELRGGNTDVQEMGRWMFRAFGPVVGPNPDTSDGTPRDDWGVPKDSGG